MTKLSYRPDIDGLRAIAVLGVVIYHAFPGLLPGGFSGVDIFFVISGYLIAGILYRGHQEGNFSFSEFYARRIRRLFPALITVLLLCLAYGWVILLPDEYQRLGKQVAVGTVFIQNFVYWKEHGYFDIAANFKPLLHLWSLAVEEQFYIFFPPLLLLILKKKWPLAPLLGALLIASMAANLVMSVQDRSTDFFLTPYRAWEFLGGSLLAWWHYDKGHEEDVLFHRNLLSTVGVILLGSGMVFIQRGTPYPGWRALFPVVGTLLLIEGGKGALVNKRILSNPMVLWVGLISYPLYLFHWPLLSFVYFVEGMNPKPASLAAALGLCLLLTTLTYYFIKKKIRHRQSQGTVPALVLLFLITGALGVMVWSGVLHASSSRGDFADAIRASAEESTPKRVKFLKSSPNTVLYQMGEQGRRTLCVGDSNMEQYSPRINRVFHDSGSHSRGALMLWCGGVPPLPGIEEKEHPGSQELLPTMERLLDEDPMIDRVVIGADWVLYCSLKSSTPYRIHGHSFPSAEAQADAIHELQGLIESLKKRGKIVYVVLNIPIDPSQDPKSEIERGFLGVASRKVESLRVALFDSLYGDFLKRMKIACEQSGARVIDPLPFFAKNGIYPRLVNGAHLYKDGGHLRASYVRDHVTYLDEALNP